MAKKAQNTGKRPVSTVPKTKSGRQKKRISSKRKKKKEIKVGVKAVIAIMAALGLCIIWPYLSDRSDPERGAAVPEGAYLYGIDISHYQTDIIWDSLMVLTDASGKTIHSKINARDIKPVSFVFIKATEGSNMKDKHFSKHWKAAEENGIRRGAYHFFRSSKNPEIQARNFIRTVGDLAPGDLPPVLDIETIHSGCSRKTLNERAARWLEYIEEHYGCKPIVYSSSSFINDILSDSIKDNYPIWVAHYGTSEPGYGDWKLWQFSDKAIVYGLEGYIDLNVCTPGYLDSI